MEQADKNTRERPVKRAHDIPQREGVFSKWKGKRVATPSALKPGDHQVASTCDNDSLSDELEDGNAYNRDDSGDESHSPIPVPTSATSGMG